jgi:hypothetical protein
MVDLKSNIQVVEKAEPTEDLKSDSGVGAKKANLFLS